MTQFGLAIRNFVGPGELPDVPALYAYAERAEALGFESLWAWDHVILGVEPSFPILDSITALGAIAARTRRIKLGTGVLVLPLRNPVTAAKALGSLDVISAGRLVLGVAAGWYAREFDAVGVPFKQRGRLFERNLDVLIRPWTEDRVTLRVDEFNLREAVMVPKPAQRPRPPILIGGYVDAVLKRAATKGDGWLTYYYTVESFTRTWAKVRGYAEEAGRNPDELSATNQLPICIGPRSKIEEPMKHWLQTEWDYASWSESTMASAIMGTPEECVEQLEPHLATGIDRIIFVPYRYEKEQIEALARDVIPRLQKKTG